MRYIKCVDGVQRIFNGNYLTDYFVIRNEQDNCFEIRETSCDENCEETYVDSTLITTVPLSYNTDVLLLVYTAYQDGYANGVRDSH